MTRLVHVAGNVGGACIVALLDDDNDIIVSLNCVPLFLSLSFLTRRISGSYALLSFPFHPFQHEFPLDSLNVDSNDDDQIDEKKEAHEGNDRVAQLVPNADVEAWVREDDKVIADADQDAFVHDFDPPMAL